MKVGLIGAGNMARAIARGWGDPVLCSDSGSGRAAALVAELGGEALSNVEVAERADLVVLCHKPYQLNAVAQEIGGRAKVVASILGGTSPSALRSAYPEAQVFRLMPNTPVEIRQGIVLYAGADADVDAAVQAQVLALFERLGRVVTLPESQLEAAAAVMSVGPAYVALVAEAQVDAAIRHGLPAPLASELVAGTLAGTAALLAARDYDTLAVRREVTSPGGSTARGLDALERNGLRAAFQAAADAVIRGERR
jgi:pyrroline-5-carboxylate reductase